MLNKTKYWLTSYFLIFLSCCQFIPTHSKSIHLVAPYENLIECIERNQNGKFRVVLQKTTTTLITKLFSKFDKIELSQPTTLNELINQYKLANLNCDFYLAHCYTQKKDDQFTYSFEIIGQLEADSQLLGISDELAILLLPKVRIQFPNRWNCKLLKGVLYTGSFFVTVQQTQETLIKSLNTFFSMNPQEPIEPQEQFEHEQIFTNLLHTQYKKLSSKPIPNHKDGAILVKEFLLGILPRYEMISSDCKSGEAQTN